MNAEQYFVGFDAGTGAGRCIIVDPRGNLLASTYAEWTYSCPREAPRLGKEFNPDEFWRILARLLREAIARANIDPRKIIGVSATSQREGMVFLDGKGKELYAGPSVDCRGWREVERLQFLEDQLRLVTGLKPEPFYGPARLLWFKRHRPDIYDRVTTVLMISDWIAYRLTGVRSSEPSIASSSQLFDLRLRNWSLELLEQLGIRDGILPPVYPSATCIGSVTRKAARETGLSPGVAVAAGGGDVQLGLLGMGLTESNRIGVVAGTSTGIMLTLDRVLIDPKRRVSTNCYTVPGQWALESNAGMTGLPYRWLRNTMLPQASQAPVGQDRSDFAYMDQLASEVPPGAEGMMAHIGAARMDASDAVRSDLGGFLFPVSWSLEHYDLRHFFRAALEAMAYGVRANVDQISEIGGINPSRLHVCGGQTKSDSFNQILANTTSGSIVIPEIEEASALGAAICAAVGTGHYSCLSEGAEAMVRIGQVVEPEPRQVAVHDEMYRRWLDTNEHLADFAGVLPRFR